MIPTLRMIGTFGCSAYNEKNNKFSYSGKTILRSKKKLALEDCYWIRLRKMEVNFYNST